MEKYLLEGYTKLLYAIFPLQETTEREESDAQLTFDWGQAEEEQQWFQTEHPLNTPPWEGVTADGPEVFHGSFARPGWEKQGKESVESRGTDGIPHAAEVLSFKARGDPRV